MKDKILAILIKHKVKGEIQDEFLDHYLTRYEHLLSNGISKKAAAQKTFSEINIKQLKRANKAIFFIHQKRKIQIAMLAISLFTLLSILQFTTSVESNPEVIVDHEIMQSDSIQLGKLLDGPIHVSSHFGLRKHPLMQKELLHKGIDLKANIGDAVYSPLDGIVEKVGYDQKRGNYIELSHAEGYTTRYYHLSKVSLGKNQAITKGKKIGEVGSSGMALSPHLHFEISKKETLKDPRDYLRV